MAVRVSSSGKGGKRSRTHTAAAISLICTYERDAVVGDEALRPRPQLGALGEAIQRHDGRRAIDSEAESARDVVDDHLDAAARRATAQVGRQASLVLEDLRQVAIWPRRRGRIAHATRLHKRVPSHLDVISFDTAYGVNADQLYKVLRDLALPNPDEGYVTRDRMGSLVKTYDMNRSGALEFDEFVKLIKGSREYLAKLEGRSL